MYPKLSANGTMMRVNYFLGAATARNSRRPAIFSGSIQIVRGLLETPFSGELSRERE